MMPRLQSTLDVRIEPGLVVARSHSWRGEVTVHQPVDAAWDVTLHEVLGRSLHKQALAKPRVRICLAMPELRSSVLRFEALPRRQDDRRLIVTQRFCRDHKLDARTTAVAYSIHSTAKGHSILVAALPRALLHSVTTALAGYGLHCDVIASELSLALAGYDPTVKPAPSVLVVEARHGIALLLLAAGGEPLSVSVLSPGDGGDLAQRLKSRLARYATVLGVAVEAIALYRSAPADVIGFERTRETVPTAAPVTSLPLSEVAA